MPGERVGHDVVEGRAVLGWGERVKELQHVAVFGGVHENAIVREPGPNDFIWPCLANNGWVLARAPGDLAFEALVGGGGRVGGLS